MGLGLLASVVLFFELFCLLQLVSRKLLLFQLLRVSSDSQLEPLVLERIQCLDVGRLAEPKHLAEHVRLICLREVLLDFLDVELESTQSHVVPKLEGE